MEQQLRKNHSRRSPNLLFRDLDYSHGNPALMGPLVTYIRVSIDLEKKSNCFMRNRWLLQ